ncbi:hypothetical protein, partial [Tepidimonas sp.]|uniref:hypothetical protein n=1 Tax=Tepidimonas sp. TaxID=2002775 RepID=UPI002FE09682
MMVGLLISMFVVASAFGAYLVQSRESRDLVAENKLAHSLSSAALVMASELRRTGYIKPGASAGNPFAEVWLGSGCVLYSYDRYNTSLAETPDGQVQAQERSGFRLNAGVLEVRTSGAAMNSCSDSADAWVAMSDINTAEITAFAVQMNARCLNLAQQSVSSGPCASAVAAAASGSQFEASAAARVRLRWRRPPAAA